MHNTYREGELAARSGLLETSNPYEEGSDESNDWYEGYDSFHPMVKNHGKPSWQ